MRTIREILLTEYIGAIVMGVLIADAISSLVTTIAERVAYHVQVTSQPALAQRFPLSVTYSLLAVLTRTALYLGLAYLLARWLYPAKQSPSHAEPGSTGHAES